MDLAPIQTIQQQIFALRGHRVLMDRELADLFGVETRVLNQAVRRNPERFPEDFMFRVTAGEAKAIAVLRSQSVILDRGGHSKYAPYVFTEHGVVMLANGLRSDRAVRASIMVVRAFVNLRRMLTTQDDLLRKVETIERRVGKHDAEIREVVRILRELLGPRPDPPKRRIGFMA